MKKGFTLIELLGTVVILAIISSLVLIVTINILEASKKSAFKTSSLNAIYAYNNLLNLGGYENNSIDVENVLLPLENNNFIDGTLTFDQNTKIVTANYITDGTYCADGVKGYLIVVKGSCDLIDNYKAKELVANPSSVDIYAGDDYDLLTGVYLNNFKDTPLDVEINYSSTPVFDKNTVGTYEILYSVEYHGVTYTKTRTINVLYQGVNLSASPDSLTIYKDSTYDLLTGVALKDINNTVIPNTITYTSSPAFTTAAVGTYTITYSSVYKGTTYTKTRTIEVIYEGVNLVVSPSIVNLESGTSYTMLTGVSFIDKNGTTVPGTITYTSSPSYSNTTLGGYTITYGVTYRGTTYTKTRTMRVYQALTTYSYTGGSQTFDVIATGRYKVELWGAQAGSGGQGLCSGGLGGSGGGGGYIQAMVDLTAGESFTVVVGGAGGNAAYSGNYGVGGYNGGTNGASAGGVSGAGGGGGGATTFRTSSTTYLRANGGGGGGGGADGGYYRYSSGATTCGGCGSRNAGAAGGAGGSGASAIAGGAGAPNSCGATGSSGSGGTYYINTTYMTYVANTVGTKTGNGYARITYAG